MSNWRYANDVPTTPWRGALSLPRALSLRRTPDGLRLLPGARCAQIETLRMGSVPVAVTTGTALPAAADLAF